MVYHLKKIILVLGQTTTTFVTKINKHNIYHGIKTSSKFNYYKKTIEILKFLKTQAYAQTQIFKKLSTKLPSNMQKVIWFVIHIWL